jgi:hypothetical protein
MNKKWIRYFVFIVAAAFLQSCYREETVFDINPDDLLELPALLKLDSNLCFYDAGQNMLRYSLFTDSLRFSPFVEHSPNAVLFFEDEKLENKTINNFGEVKIGESYNLRIETDGSKKEFDLVFTNLPIVQLIVDSEIHDEPKTLARIRISEVSRSPGFNSFAGVEKRGKFSRYFPKRSMGFALWNDMNNTSEYSAGLLGMKPNTDWILNGAVIDPSRIRNLASFEIWNNLPGWINEETTPSFKIQSKLTELFINNQLRGIYVFSERINREFLQAGNDAVLYKGVEWAGGATRFENYKPELSGNRFWNGWEQEIPDPDIKVDWHPLKSLYELVIDSADDKFKSNITKVIDIENFIDYFLSLNLTSAADNTGKNIFLYRPIQTARFEIIPWDLDGSWGITYDGSKMSYDAILKNNLFVRLMEANPDNFRTKIKNRWFFLRENSFSEENLNQVFHTYFQKMEMSGILEYENSIWDENIDFQSEKEYIQSWTTNRLEFLDVYFSKL